MQIKHLLEGTEKLVLMNIILHYLFSLLFFNSYKFLDIKGTLKPIYIFNF